MKQSMVGFRVDSAFEEMLERALAITDMDRAKFGREAIRVAVARAIDGLDPFAGEQLARRALPAPIREMPLAADVGLDRIHPGRAGGVCQDQRQVDPFPRPIGGHPAGERIMAQGGEIRDAMPEPCEVQRYVQRVTAVTDVPALAVRAQLNHRLPGG